MKKSLRLRVRGGGGGAMVWVECRCEGVRVVVGVVYASPEGVRVVWSYVGRWLGGGRRVR